MTLSTRITLVDGRLQVHARTLLSSVPSNVSLTSARSMGLPQGAFLGATSSSHDSRSHHLVFPLGILEGLRFLCLFRYKLWWMVQRMGTCGKDVPFETQFLLVEDRDGSPTSDDKDGGTCEETIYTLFLPLFEGAFRATLQGNEKNELQLCLESGDTETHTLQGVYSVFVTAGTNPFQLISDSVRTVEMHLQTFRRLEEKKMPGLLDWLGWCTWDAFYRDVTAQGIKEALESLIAGGIPPRFVLIDDGWQSVASDGQPATDTVSTGGVFETRLTNIKENYKFQKDGKEGQRQEDPELGLKYMVDELKRRHNVKYVYVWQAISGYWGGVRPGVAGMEHYEAALKYPVHSPGIIGNQAPAKNDALDFMAALGMGLVHPKKAFRFYDELHSYLAAAGIDGVKIDVQNILETVGEGFGGRVSLTRQYLEALEASIARNFPDNGCIASMCHNTEGIYGFNQTAIVRVSDDFFPEDPPSHTIHIATVAYNSLFLGELMQPDWDMFYSLHPAAEYHAAARAVGGCMIYVSDKPGHHNFELLKKVALPDGSVLRARFPGRPTRDCLFSDPVRDGKSLLKIWNLNKHTGVLGVFNCQGAGWCGVAKTNVVHDKEPKAMRGSVRGRDVEFLERVAGDDWGGDCVMYSHRGGELVRLPKSLALPVKLKVLEYEVFTVTPVKDIGSLGISFAPIGLITMLNAGGAINSLEYDIRNHGHGRMNNVVVDDLPIRGGVEDAMSMNKTPNSSSSSLASSSSSLRIALVVKMRIRGCGELGFYSSVPPKRLLVNQSLSLDFTYHAKTGLAILLLPASPQEGYLSDVQVEI